MTEKFKNRLKKVDIVFKFLWAIALISWTALIFIKFSSHTLPVSDVVSVYLRKQLLYVVDWCSLSNLQHVLLRSYRCCTRQFAVYVHGLYLWNAKTTE
jgi:hypothetical protein